MCTQCDAAKMLLANTAGGCECMPGYAADSSGACQTCSFFMSNCNTCSDNATCTACNAGTGVILTAGSPQLGLCIPCGTIFTGCTSCINDASCTACGPSYASNGTGCDLCGTFAAMSNCVLCSTNATCTSCTTFDYMLNAGTGLCQLCSFFMPGCLTCDSTANCLSCDSANNFEFSGTACDCVLPLVLKTATGTC